MALIPADRSFFSVISVLTGLFLAPTSASQGPPPCQAPTACGQWSMVYDLKDDVTENGTWPNTFEIAHAVLLPPIDMETQLNQRVLIQCVGGYSCEQVGELCQPPSPQKWGRTYLWKPNRIPFTAEPIPVPGTYPQDGSQDFFCGGHTFLADGRLLWAGGTDMQRTCTNLMDCSSAGGEFYGHVYAWLLDTSTPLPTWSEAGSGAGTSTMERERWYPTLTLMNDGDVMVHGHVLNPEPVLPELAHDFWREAYDPTIDQWDDLGFLNNRLPCASPEAIRTGDYPRMHLLSNGMLMHTNPFSHAAGVPPTRYLDIDPQPWSCQPFLPSTRLWHDSGVTPLEERLDGGSVHLTTWDAMEDTFTETIYVVGGARTFFDQNECGLPFNPADILSSVEKITNPSPLGTSPPVWDSSLLPMNFARAKHNTVILLDGSIMVVGGVGSDGTNCIPRLDPERYEPQEVFGNAVPSWELMAPQACWRGYHSSAGVLPDGRVFSTGGLTVFPHPLCGGADSRYTAEIYSPPYLFRAYRPEINIDSVAPLQTKMYQENVQFTVQLLVDRTIDRIALLRNGASTHAFDMDQRYVELRIVLANENPPDSGVFDVTVQMPVDGFTAPPGHYMLTVVDDSQQPSDAVWIRLDGSQ